MNCSVEQSKLQRPVYYVHDSKNPEHYPQVAEPLEPRSRGRFAAVCGVGIAAALLMRVMVAEPGFVLIFAYLIQYCVWYGAFRNVTYAKANAAFATLAFAAIAPLFWGNESISAPVFLVLLAFASYIVWLCADTAWKHELKSRVPAPNMRGRRRV